MVEFVKVSRDGYLTRFQKSFIINGKEKGIKRGFLRFL
jgi:hypothetical protein